MVRKKYSNHEISYHFEKPSAKEGVLGEAKVTLVIDADTINIEPIDAVFDQLPKVNSVRFSLLDADEVDKDWDDNGNYTFSHRNGHPLGVPSTEFVRDLIQGRKVKIDLRTRSSSVRSEPGKPKAILEVGRYGRLIGIIYVQLETGEWVNVNRTVIKSGLGKVGYSRDSNLSSKEINKWKVDYYNNGKKKQKEIDQQIEKESFDDRSLFREKAGLPKFNPNKNIRIGDVQFRIPPESISVSTISDDDPVEVLRNQTTLKGSTGHHRKVIEFKMYFNGEDDINGIKLGRNKLKELENKYEQEINIKIKRDDKDIYPDAYYLDGLRPFLAQFKVSPFLPVENDLINLEHEISAVSLQNISISNVSNFNSKNFLNTPHGMTTSQSINQTTISNFPNLVEATITLVEFNHEAYLDTQLPFESVFDWSLFRFNYQRLLEGSNMQHNGTLFPMVKNIDSDYFSFAVTKPEELERKENAINRLRQFNHGQDIDLLRGDSEYELLNHDFKVLDTARRQKLFWELNFFKKASQSIIQARQGKDSLGPIDVSNYSYLLNDGYWVGIDDYLKSAVKSDDLYDKVFYRPSYYHHGDIDFLKDNPENIKHIQYRQWSSSQVIFSPTYKLRIRSRILLSYLNSINGVNDYEDDDDDSLIGLAIDLVSSGNENNRGSSNKAYDNKDKYVERVVTVETANRLYEFIKNRKDKIEKEFKESEELAFDFKPELEREIYPVANATLQHVTAVQSNKITEIKLNMHNTPTHQYMGGDQIIVSASFICDEATVMMFNDMVEQAKSLHNRYHNIIDLPLVTFNQDIVDLLDLDGVSIMDMNSSTVPGNPGVRHLQINMNGYKKAKTFESLNHMGNIGRSTTLESRASRTYADYFGLQERMKYVNTYPDLEVPKKCDVPINSRHFNYDDNTYLDPDFYIVELRSGIQEILKEVLHDESSIDSIAVDDDGSQHIIRTDLKSGQYDIMNADTKESELASAIKDTNDGEGLEDVDIVKHKLVDYMLPVLLERNKRRRGGDRGLSKNPIPNDLNKRNRIKSIATGIVPMVNFIAAGLSVRDTWNWAQGLGDENYNTSPIEIKEGTIKLVSQDFLTEYSDFPPSLIYAILNKFWYHQEKEWEDKNILGKSVSTSVSNRVYSNYFLDGRYKGNRILLDKDEKRTDDLNEAAYIGPLQIPKTAVKGSAIDLDKLSRNPWYGLNVILYLADPIIEEILQSLPRYDFQNTPEWIAQEQNISTTRSLDIHLMPEIDGQIHYGQWHDNNTGSLGGALKSDLPDLIISKNQLMQTKYSSYMMGIMQVMSSTENVKHFGTQKIVSTESFIDSIINKDEEKISELAELSSLVIKGEDHFKDEEYDFSNIHSSSVVNHAKAYKGRVGQITASANHQTEIPMNRTLQDSFHDLISYDKRGRLVRAFPSFYMMLIDEGKEIWWWKLQDNFYEYNGVESIDIVKSRKQVSDTCVITMANKREVLTDAESPYRKARPELNFMETIFNMSPGSKVNFEEQLRNRTFRNVQLEPGCRVHLRMGYGSSPSNMPTMFNGTITELQPDEYGLSVVAQGDGIELTNPIPAKTNDSTRKSWNFGAFREPKNIVDSVLTDESGFFTELFHDVTGNRFFNHSGSIFHFGDVNDHPVWFNNIFLNSKYTNLDPDSTGIPPEITQNINPALINEEGDKDLEFAMYIYGKSVWDVIQTCALASPNYIATVRPFGFRSTVFFGLPTHNFAYGYEKANTEEDSSMENITEKTKTFRQIHYYSGFKSIIANNVRADEESVQATIIKPIAHKSGSKDKTVGLPPSYVDCDIYPEKQKLMMLDTSLKYSGSWSYSNRFGLSARASADRVAKGTLSDSIKEMYTGEVLVMGDPSVNPYDYAYLCDIKNRMFGLFEVEQVIHTLNKQVGFVTAITPDPISIVNENAESSFNYMLLANSTTKGLNQYAFKLLLDVAFASLAKSHKTVALAAAVKISSSLAKGLKSKLKPGFTATMKAVNKHAMAQQAIATKAAKGSIVKAKTKLITGGIIKTNSYIKSAIIGGASSSYASTVSKGVASGGWKATKSIWAGSAGGFLGKAKVTPALMASTAGTGVGGISHFFMAHPKVWLLVQLAEFVAIDAFINRMQSRRERRKSLIMMFLTKNGRQYSAGINGHKGSVVGDSPSRWDKVWHHPLVNFFLGESDSANNMAIMNDVLTNNTEQFYNASMSQMNPDYALSKGVDLNETKELDYNSSLHEINNIGDRYLSKTNLSMPEQDRKRKKWIRLAQENLGDSSLVDFRGMRIHYHLRYLLKELESRLGGAELMYSNSEINIEDSSKYLYPLGLSVRVDVQDDYSFNKIFKTAYELGSGLSGFKDCGIGRGEGCMYLDIGPYWRFAEDNLDVPNTPLGNI